MKTFYPSGKVYLVGAGPGDPDLITVRGLKTLRQADVVLYDRLVNPDILAESPVHSEHIFVGKKPGKPSVSQEQINRILIIKAREQKTVVRLKGGDPFVFGRGGEECEALAEAGIPFEIVPGISSSLAAPAYAGIPVTHRSAAHSFAVVTGHMAAGRNHDISFWSHLAHVETLVILMGMRNMKSIAKALTLNGRAYDTPVAVIQKATYNDQTTTITSLGEILSGDPTYSSPATMVVGELVRYHEKLAWFGADSFTTGESKTGIIRISAS